MHEFSVMSSVVSSIIEEIERLQREEGKKIERVNEVILEVGELTFLAHEQLRFCYEILSQDNILKGSKLTIKEIKAKVHCPECGYTGPVEYYTEFHLTAPVLQCPECGHTVEILKGRECTVKAINLEVADASRTTP